MVYVTADTVLMLPRVWEGAGGDFPGKILLWVQLMADHYHTITSPAVLVLLSRGACLCRSGYPFMK